MSKVCYEQIRDFVSEKLDIPKERLNLSTRLLHDLYLDGDDAAGFLKDFSQQFGVNMNELDFRRHFSSELEAGIRWVLQKTIGPERLGYAPVTLQDLLEAANSGRWAAVQHTSGTS